MSKALEVESKNEKGYYLIFCPACGLHGIPTQKKNSLGAIWTFNNDLDKPTFYPSIKITWGGGKEGSIVRCCHFYIRNGRIEFQNDCTHDWKNKTVELSDVEYSSDNYNNKLSSIAINKYS
jgi:hypothetical protein